jgi:hypothetical protein
VAQLYPQALGSSGTSGVPFPVPAIVGPWGVREQNLKNLYMLFDVHMPRVSIVYIYISSGRDTFPDK